MNNETKVFVGLDLSVNHLGMVALYSNEKPMDYFLVVDKKKHVVSGKTVLLPKKEKEESRENYEARRRLWITGMVINYFRVLCVYELENIYLNIEDYAYSARSNSVTKIAEISGIIRNWAYQKEIKVRLTDPKSLKLFATGSGNSGKEIMIECASENGIFEDSKLSPIDDGPLGDFADAYWLAKLMETEVKVRQGEIALADLLDCERRVFLRVTKSNPINLLDRPFVC